MLATFDFNQVLFDFFFILLTSFKEKNIKESVFSQSEIIKGFRHKFKSTSPALVRISGDCKDTRMYMHDYMMLTCINKTVIFNTRF